MTKQDRDRGIVLGLLISFAAFPAAFVVLLILGALLVGIGLVLMSLRGHDF